MSAAFHPEPEKPSEEMSAEALRWRMNEVRQSLRTDAEVVADHAGDLADWRYYVKSYPGMSFAVAAMAGYLLVPKRRVGSGSLAWWSGGLRSGVESRGGDRDLAAPAPKRGALAAVAAMAGPILLRVGTAYVTQRINRAMNVGGASSNQSADQVGSAGLSELPPGVAPGNWGASSPAEADKS